MRITLLVLAALLFQGTPPDDERDTLKREFTTLVAPFVESYCIRCHGEVKPKAKFDMSSYASFDSVVGDMGHWELVLERLRAGEMPPAKTKKQPDPAVRKRVADWISRLRRHEAARNAGDPGPVLARRLSHAEYDYSIHDLTGVDIRPTREFPVDPANQAGFDNSGESLTMSPALLSKYLAAARKVADHLLFLPGGLDFAPHPVVIYSDRDKYSVHRIVDFYNKQPVDLADYFHAAWRFRHRQALGRAEATLSQVASTEGVSAKYLATVWKLLTDDNHDAGPIALLRQQWNALPKPPAGPADVRAACERLRTLTQMARRKFNVTIDSFFVKGLNRSAQPIILWKNREMAENRRRGKLPAPEGTSRRKAVARFCDVFPDAFFVSERGRMFLPPEKRNKGRLLSAGFHLMVGYFRDDGPLYDLILDAGQQKQLDAMWHELDFITRTPIRQFSDYVYFERAESPKFLTAPEFDFAREDADITSEPKMKKLARLYLAKARSAGLSEEVLEVIDAYFRTMSKRIRNLEKALEDAEPHHLNALLTQAQRAWQRPLTDKDRQDLMAFYRSLREKEGLSHEDAIRDVFVSILMSPRFFYRTTIAGPGVEPSPLSDLELAGRLSYFLWSSLPDAELMEQAAAGTLRDPDEVRRHARRMREDPRVRRLAVEFGTNWLDVRRFEAHNGVNRERFPQFTDELRHAMAEEPIRFLTELIQGNGSVLELVEGTHTFVNPDLAKHYGIPFPDGRNGWIRIEDANRNGRGGLLPMSVFLTKNSPGLRTSPVQRGYWVVRRLLGEHIPAPPPEVPELPEDEAELGELSLRDVLAKHREVESCATCHKRFDSIGLVFEGYGPVGERRQKDLGGRPVDTNAEFPDGSRGQGIDGLKTYLRKARQADFIDTLCRRLLSYALGRSLLLSDDETIVRMKTRLAASEYRFGSLIDVIVTSPQFLRKRGRDHDVGR